MFLVVIGSGSPTFGSSVAILVAMRDDRVGSCSVKKGLEMERTEIFTGLLMMIIVIDGRNHRALENVIELPVLGNGEQVHGVSVVLAVDKVLGEDRFSVELWVATNELVALVSLIL